MSALINEIHQIISREIHLDDAYPLSEKPSDPLRCVFFMPYGHAYSLLSLGTMTLYDMINRDAKLGAVAERALVYDSLVRDGNRLELPEGESTYRTIENPAPVLDADILALSITNAGNLATAFKILDLVGIPRRGEDRQPGRHPLIVGGSAGFANPEVLGDYIDVIALGEAEVSVRRLIEELPTARATGKREDMLEHIAQIPGLYVPHMYDVEYREGGGITEIRPHTPKVPQKVLPQYLSVPDLPSSHFTAPISDGDFAMMVPTLGCRWDCHFCTLGVPPFRQAPFELLSDYLDRCEKRGIRKFIISSPTFTQYGKRFDLLGKIRDFSARSEEKVTTIIGSVRADEVSNSYLDAVSELGDFGHILTELHLQNEVRGVITIAPEFANPELVRIFNKTLTRERVNRSIELCSAHPEFNTVMLYFIIGAPSEQREDRLGIADYAVDVFKRLNREDGTIIVKPLQYMPKPGTVGQRLEMADPRHTDAHVEEISRRMRDLVGEEIFDRHFRVLWEESSRMYLESVCGRGDRRVGTILEYLYDAGHDLENITSSQLEEALHHHGLRQNEFLRRMSDKVLPWEVVNNVNPEQERELLKALDERTAALTSTSDHESW
ncbi:B12-binding domain-containing radical SAM protein [Streptomyces natalensis]|uniref:B12-binding domain-containing radical SAM protein n=1 Tax=Streptomyces natalensis TaxID=68242 RepID=UPI0005650D6D|nr:radical SAM protein [Streptomyces natalensis]